MKGISYSLALNEEAREFSFLYWYIFKFWLFKYWIIEATELHKGWKLALSKSIIYVTG